MSLLTDQEIDDIGPVLPGQNALLIYAREIEQAVIAKLATVSVEWPESASSSHEVYLREQIEPMLAAARAQAIEEAAKVAEGYPKYGDATAAEIRALIGVNK